MLSNKERMQRLPLNFDYNLVDVKKEVCTRGVSPNLCDVVCKDFGNRCACAVKAYERINNLSLEKL